MAPDGLVAIRRTRGVEAARPGRDDPAQRPLIRPDGEQHEPRQRPVGPRQEPAPSVRSMLFARRGRGSQRALHSQSAGAAATGCAAQPAAGLVGRIGSISRARSNTSCTAASSAAYEASAAGARAVSTTSQPRVMPVSARRTISRSRRRTRLRTTAFPIRLETEKPQRVVPTSFGLAASVTSGWLHRRPCRRTASKSAERRRRCWSCIDASAQSWRHTRSGRGLHRQALAALGTACLEHAAAALGMHSLKKAVDALAATHFGLIGTLHGGAPEFLVPTGP